MGHGRNLRRSYAEDYFESLQPGQIFGRIVESRDKGIVSLNILDSSAEMGLAPTLAFLPPKFRGVLFLRRGAFVVLSPSEESASEKVSWTIARLLRPEDVKMLRKAGLWPSQFEAPKVESSSEDKSDSESDDSKGSFVSSEEEDQ